MDKTKAEAHQKKLIATMHEGDDEGLGWAMHEALVFLYDECGYDSADDVRYLLQLGATSDFDQLMEMLTQNDED